MRNIFDQYTQPENRLTHALFTALNEDRALLSKFLAEIAGVAAPAKPTALGLVEQRFPGQPEASEEMAPLETQNGLPDACVFSADEWILIVESKVQSHPDALQLGRHAATARKRGFTQIHILVITISLPNFALPSGARAVEWTTVYKWLQANRRYSKWAEWVANYMTILETKLIAQEATLAGALTSFTGIGFSAQTPFTYLEAKRLLSLALRELRQRKDLKVELGMVPALPGRKAITGSDADVVWDFLQVQKTKQTQVHTDHPHLTLSIGAAATSAMITIPNGVSKKLSSHLTSLGLAGYVELLTEIEKRLSKVRVHCEGLEPRIRGLQRRYKTQRSVPFVDAEIDADIRTVIGREPGPKKQTQWAHAIFDALSDKHSNFQVQIGARFPYRTCQSAKTPALIGFIAESWIACSPLLEILAD